MALTAIAFYTFATVAIASGLFVVMARNPVHSVLWLILTFFTAAGMFVLMGAEFVAMLLIIVYVGAVMVLFLFVVMMLDVDFAELKKGIADYLPIGALIGVVLLLELGLVLGAWALAPEAPAQRQAVMPAPQDLQNTEALGQIVYTQYVLAFQSAGIVLLIAMIGAIVLTLRSRPGVKRQSIDQQNLRRREDVVDVVKVTRGGGV